MKRIRNEADLKEGQAIRAQLATSGRVYTGERVQEARIGRAGTASEARVGSSGVTSGLGAITVTSVTGSGTSRRGTPYAATGTASGAGTALTTGISASGAAYAARGTTSATRPASATVIGSGSSTGSPLHPLKGLLNTILTTIQGNTTTLAGILDEQKWLSDSIIELQQKSFTIEGSVYKEDLLKEIGTIFGNTVNRMPSQTMVKAMVNRVLKREAEKKYKYSAAITCCNSQFNELRAEERRRILGLQPCEKFAAMRVDEFVERFLPVLKVELHTIPHYARQCDTIVADSNKNTYKAFNQWLNGQFANGMPTAEEWDSIVAESQPVLDPSNSPSYMSPPNSPSYVYPDQPETAPSY
ncbi:hypothetical protein EMCRGX_G017817 [Ephydatia muelleri]